MYNLCRERYNNDSTSSSDLFVNLAGMINKYGIQGEIPSQEAIVKEVVKLMHVNLKNEYIQKWRDDINTAAKCELTVG